MLLGKPGVRLLAIDTNRVHGMIRCSVPVRITSTHMLLWSTTEIPPGSLTWVFLAMTF